MRPRWYTVIVLGLIAGVLRPAAPSQLADMLAIAYLLIATVAFERRGRIAAATASATSSSKDAR